MPPLEDMMHAFLRESHDEHLRQAMQYSLDAGGKRLRPLLTLATCVVLGGDVANARPAAAAVEFVHTYSLIHDDLPAMDDSDMRRGQPANHIKFGEATAILAGDALLTDAFSMLARTPDQVLIPDLLMTLATAAGSQGMVAGQMQDIDGSHEQLDKAALIRLDRHKTGALLRAAVRNGALCAGASLKQLQLLDDFAAAFGLGFQVKDDIEDASGTVAELGKPVGQDVDNAKNTYVALYGLAGAQNKLQEQRQLARKALAQLDGNMALLEQITDYLN
ncbi:polyprenyl synthetase family protein [Lacticaseibacillus zhaodongensis]|uniref:polyprenyl synthetase family protein n=1 Tax=Lacticaseibacillus zhaodongensis TaxID=2668065 RepID=UPI00353164A8